MTLRFTTAGESHGRGLVAILEGIPAGLPVSAARVDAASNASYARGEVHENRSECLFSLAVLDNVVLAEYHCHYDWCEHKVQDIRPSVFYPACFASSQGWLIPLTPQESLVLYRPEPLRRPSQRLFPAQQLWLFELVRTA